jgi:hypothetical protein
MAEYFRFSKDLIDSLHPETAEELAYAQTIADGHWRLKRVRTWEESLIALGHYEGEGDFDAEHEAIHAAFTGAKTFRAHEHSFVNLTLYEHRIHRTIERAKKALREAQADRKEHRNAEMQQVLRMRDFNEMKGLAYEPAEDGFVYSSVEIEREAGRRTRFEQAKIAERCRFNHDEYLKMAA